MTVGLLVYAIVPVCVVVLMFGVGLNLNVMSLLSILRNPRSLVVATLLQITMLPAIALLLIAVFQPEPLVALAIIAIAASPGGALSNAFTHLVGGNLAFSVLMTTTSTLLVSVTAPVVVTVSLASGLLAQGAAASLDPVAVTRDLLQFALLPIGFGLLAVHVFPRAAPALRRAGDVLGLLAVVTVFVASAIVSLPVFGATSTGALFHALLFSLGALVAGLVAARALPRDERSACFIEFGIRNLPVALVLASGGSPSAELVAFLLCYFLVNASIVLGAGLLARARLGRVAV